MYKTFNSLVRSGDNWAEFTDWREAFMYANIKAGKLGRRYYLYKNDDSYWLAQMGNELLQPKKVQMNIIPKSMIKKYK